MVNTKARQPAEGDRKEFVLISIISAMGGKTDSSDHDWHWLQWFCNDERAHDKDDTFNRCHARGWLHTTHESDFETSTTTLTDQGRKAIEEGWH